MKFPISNNRIEATMTPTLPVHYQNGLPLDLTGKLCVVEAEPTGYLNGLPFDAQGYLCIALGVAPLAVLAVEPMAAVEPAPMPVAPAALPMPTVEPLGLLHRVRLAVARWLSPVAPA
jgi:hypothetical protein